VPRCFICGDVIDESNSSDEHVILASIGGLLKSKKLICKNCNSKFGQQIDFELSSQLSSFVNLLNIKRRDRAPAILATNDKTGEQYYLSPGGKPYSAKPEFKNEGKHIQIKARTMEEAKKMLKGVAKKYSEINVGDILDKAEIEKRYIDDKLTINMNFGGSAVFKSVCKSAIEFYLINGGNVEDIKHLIPYITSKEDNRDIIVSRLFYGNKIECKDKSSGVFHSIFIIGEQSENILYAFVEFFSAIKYIVLLNDNYNGKSVKYSYVFDVLQGIEIDAQNITELNKEGLKNALYNYSPPYEDIKTCISHVLQIANEREEKSHINQMVETAIENSFKKYPEGVLITEEMIEKFIEELMKEIGPWVAHNFKDTDNI